jgi:hypothetical protein
MGRFGVVGWGLGTERDLSAFVFLFAYTYIYQAASGGIVFLFRSA